MNRIRTVEVVEDELKGVVTALKKCRDLHECLLLSRMIEALKDELTRLRRFGSLL